MATLLDDQLVADALTNLPDWSGDVQRISRRVQVDDPDALVEAVAELADTLNHHPKVEREGDELGFVLWTHSEGGVTELDIALASRIDDLILLAQHRERPPVNAAPNPEDEQSYPSDKPTSGTFHEAPTPCAGAGPAALPDDE
jgi:4a-hydroxytetrahydrobiopterin dehydratase